MMTNLQKLLFVSLCMSTTLAQAALGGNSGITETNLGGGATEFNWESKAKDVNTNVIVSPTFAPKGEEWVDVATSNGHNMSETVSDALLGGSKPNPLDVKEFAGAMETFQSHPVSGVSIGTHAATGIRIR